MGFDAKNAFSDMRKKKANAAPVWHLAHHPTETRDVVVAREVPQEEATATVALRRDDAATAVLQPVQKLMALSDMVVNRTNLAACGNSPVVEFDLRRDNRMAFRAYRLLRIVRDPGQSMKGKLQAFFSAFADLPERPTVSFILQNRMDASGRYVFSLYLGVRSQEKKDNYVSGTLIDMLRETFEGIFPGSEFAEEELDEKDIAAIEAAASPVVVNTSKSGARSGNVVVSVAIQPSEKQGTDGKSIEEGLDQFIDVMSNKRYTAVLLASSVSGEIARLRERELENLYTKLSANRKLSLASGYNESRAIGKNLSETTGVTTTDGTSFTKTTSRSTTTGMTQTMGSSSGSSSNGSSSSSSSSTSYSRSVTFGSSESQGTSHSVGVSDSKTTGSQDTTTTGTSQTFTIEIENKPIVNLLERVDETLKTIHDSEIYGLWECAGYFIAETLPEATFAANTFKALALGDVRNNETCYMNRWGRNAEDGNVVLKDGLQTRQQALVRSIIHGIHPRIKPSNIFEQFREITPTNLVSGRELPLFMPLPIKSVPGLVVDEIASFERSVHERDAVNKGGGASPRIRLGSVYHKGRTEVTDVCLNADSFTQHCFVTGSTGCGKSNTTYLLLQRLAALRDAEGNPLDVGFLVVEPAKGEYKIDLKSLGGVKIYTTYPLCERLLRLNPFRFHVEIHVLEHIDRLLNIFSACWELTSAMPAILKKGVESAYRAVGWDLANSLYNGDGEPQYPTFATLVASLRQVIDASGYSAEVKGNYTGALVTRVESLASGILRQMFCSEKDVDYADLFDGRAIIDLSRLGSPETKSLVMGLVVTLLQEYRSATANGTNKGLRHVTVLEEAHNLLRNTANGGEDLVRKSVEMLSGAIAEMRTYGEGFVIVDQSPTAVDISAIKNTNTKIVMRLPEQHDCEAVAAAMGLDEFQTREISRFPRGVAVVMQNNWTSAVLTKIDAAGDTRGVPENTNKDLLCQLRASLAFAVAAAGRAFSDAGKSGKTPAAVAAPSRDDVLALIDAARQDGRIGDARRDELRGIVEWYASRNALWDGRTTTGALVRYGRLAIALLNCHDCWRMIVGRHFATNDEARAEFRKVLARYIPADARGSKDDMAALVVCTRSAFACGAIVDSGGTTDDQNSFTKLILKL